jgi:hypothetical protein
MTKTKTLALFPDLWNDKAAFQKLIFKFATTKAVLTELKKHPRTGYWANSPEAIGEWADPKWLTVERHEYLHLLYEDGSGNLYFISEKNGEVWEFIHDDVPKGSEYGYFGPARGMNYDRPDSYQRFLEWLREYTDDSYESPYRTVADRTQSASLDRPAKSTAFTMKQRLQAARQGLIGGSLAGVVIGGGVGAIGGGGLPGVAAGAIGGGVGLGILHGARSFINPDVVKVQEEFVDDLELYFALDERGGAHSSRHGMADTGAGDRAIASKSRIGGADALRSLIPHINEAFRAGGWDGSTAIMAVVTDDSHDQASGREWSLRGAIAFAVLSAPADKPDPDAAEQAFHDDKTPAEAIEFKAANRCITVELSYLSDGTGAPGYVEMANILRSNGITVTENI